MVVYKMLTNGAFVCGDTETRVTSYSYPSSPNAATAKNDERLAAEEFIRRELNHRKDGSVDRDEHNWNLLGYKFELRRS